jgi:hypothetical protein
MVKQIKFTITKEGKVELEVMGGAGPECLTLTKPFEEKLGVLSERSFKDSFYANTESNEATSNQDIY